MTDDYTPPKVWTWDDENGGQFSKTNRPIAGATHDKDLPVGSHPLQLYSLATPNGVKVTVMLEELLALGHKGAEYDAWLINIGEGDQFGSGFVGANPNSKIPALVDHTSSKSVRVFESGSIRGAVPAFPGWLISLELSQQYQYPAPTATPARRTQFAVCGVDMVIVSVAHFGAESLSNCCIARPGLPGAG